MLGQQWIEEKKLVPLLDGLDEVAAERQELCVQQINEFLASEVQPSAIVVCSRGENYRLYKTNFNLMGTICLKPLTLMQIQEYLQNLEQGELAASVATDAGLRDLVQTPLLLSMAVLAFEGSGLEQWRGLTTEADRLTWLLDASVVARLQKEYRGKAYAAGQGVPSAPQTRQWLGWLARLMAQQSQTDFLIEGLQPRETLTTRPEKLLIRVGVGLMFSPIVILLASPRFDLMFSLVLGLMGGLMFGLTVNFYRVAFVKTLKMPVLPAARQESWRIIKDWVLVGLLVGLMLGLVFGLTYGLKNGLIATLIFGLGCGLLFGLAFGLPRGLYSSIAPPTEPNQSIRNSIHNVKLLGTIGFSLFLIVCLSLIVLVEGFKVEEVIKLNIQFIFLGYSLLYSPLTYQYEHLIIRLVLTFRQKVTPWNYARFLNYCTEITLLQRVGGRYRFVHKLLQDHFAQLPPSQP